MSRVLQRLRAYARVLPAGKRNTTDLLRYLARRPALGAAVATYEVALLASGRVDNRVRSLAQLQASRLTGCPF